MILPNICASSLNVNQTYTNSQILVTYIIEAFFTLFFLLASRLFTLERTIHSIRYVLHLLRYFRPPSDKYSGFLTRRVRSLCATRFCHCTIQLVVEFQEAQIFLILATSIAALFALYQPVVFGSAESWGSIEADQHMIYLCTAAGLISVTTTQLALNRLRKSSVYSLLFATVSCALAARILLNKHSYNYDDIYQQFNAQFRKGGSLPKCGNNPPLTVYCAPEASLGKQNRLVPIAAILSMAILSSLWCSKARDLILPNNDGIPSDWRRRSILIPWFWNESSRKALKLCFAACALLSSVFSWTYEAFCLYVMGHTTCQLIKYLRIFVFQDSSDLSKGYQAVPWNMGQIIAVLVWSPVLARYLYALLCKYLYCFTSWSSS